VYQLSPLNRKFCQPIDPHLLSAGFSIKASKAFKADPAIIGTSSPGNSYVSNVSRISSSTNSNSSGSST
jgi:hypothetical protein